jgi:hypothetical protein
VPVETMVRMVAGAMGEERIFEVKRFAENPLPHHPVSLRTPPEE